MTKVGMRVLVVDDEIAIQRFLRVALNGEGLLFSKPAAVRRHLQS